MLSDAPPRDGAAPGPLSSKAMSSRERGFLCPVLHAERLHIDDVWQAVCSLLTAVERRHGRMTLFVSPFWPMVADIDIAGRLTEIAGRGHEIAQHTHFYAWDGVPGSEYRKRTDMSPDNVLGCLGRDYFSLCESGFRPVGFTSGGWEAHAVIPGWLSDNGFTYDCSTRTYQAPAGPVSPPGSPVLDVATTHSLRLALLDLRDGRLSGRPISAHGRPYALCYTHDYDLLRPGRLAAMKAVVLMGSRGSRCTAVGDLVEAVAT